jgi:hypothetical protein
MLLCGYIGYFGDVIDFWFTCNFILRQAKAYVNV